MPAEGARWYTKHPEQVWSVLAVLSFLALDIVMTAIAGLGIWTLQSLLLVHTPLFLLLLVIYIHWTARRVREGARRRWTGSRWYNGFKFALFVVGFALGVGSLAVTQPFVLSLSLLSTAVVLLVVFAYILAKSRKPR